jgi:hypothetical protein
MIMGFQKVDPDLLEPNKEYKIGNKLRGIYTGTTTIVLDYYPETYEAYLTFDNVRTLQNVPFSRHIFAKFETFYEFFSEKAAIQTCMEYRAVNLILRRVIGDESFSW